jgi:hypothetical protein
MAKADGKDVLDREHVEKMLYSGRGLPGGGQLEIRIEKFQPTIPIRIFAAWLAESNFSI